MKRFVCVNTQFAIDRVLSFGAMRTEVVGTPDLDSTYAVESYAVLEQLRLRREALSGAQLRQRFPQFDADGGWLDVDAGFADLTAVPEDLPARTAC